MSGRNLKIYRRHYWSTCVILHSSCIALLSDLGICRQCWAYQQFGKTLDNFEKKNSDYTFLFYNTVLAYQTKYNNALLDLSVEEHFRNPCKMSNNLVFVKVLLCKESFYSSINCVY